jgi:hypothetical protein
MGSPNMPNVAGVIQNIPIIGTPAGTGPLGHFNEQSNQLDVLEAKQKKGGLSQQEEAERQRLRRNLGYGG